MSESHEIISDIVDDRASATTDPVLNLRSGLTFTSEIEGNIDPLIVESELGEDAREVVLLHVTSDVEASYIRPGDRVKFTLFGATTTHEIVKRRNNAGNPQTDFWARKWVTGKDT
jgi:hypothetical protein